MRGAYKNGNMNSICFYKSDFLQLLPYNVYINIILYINSKLSLLNYNTSYVFI